MDITSSKHGQAIVLHLSGRIDVTSAPVLQAEVLKIIERGDRLIITDMTDVEYISSAGINSILHAGRALHAEQGELRFYGLTGLVKELFSVASFADVFDIFDSLESALNAD